MVLLLTSRVKIILAELIIEAWHKELLLPKLEFIGFLFQKRITRWRNTLYTNIFALSIYVLAVALCISCKSDAKLIRR